MKTNPNLELIAMRWLWLKRNCHYLVEQRSPRHHLGSPDALGVTKARFLIEIEIKRSASDFCADSHKPHRINRGLFLTHQAKEFYYLMPRELAVKLKPKIPEWSGLMCDLRSFDVEILKPSPINKESKRLSVKECVRMARCVVNHYMAEYQRKEFKSRDDLDFVELTNAEKGTYQI